MDTPKPITVRDLLDVTCRPEHRLGEGHYAVGYAFPEGYGLDGYVLRIKKDLALSDLDDHTAMKPVSDVLTHVHVGQTLMQFDAEHVAAISIVKRTSGHSLEHLLADYLKQFAASTHPDLDACSALMEHVLQVQERTGTNPFTPLLRTVIDLRLAGCHTDLNRDNTLLDPETHTLGLVDQLSFKHQLAHYSRPKISTKDMKHDANKLFLEISRYNKITLENDLRNPEGKHYEALAIRLKTMLDEAHKTVMQETTYIEKTPIGFAHVESTRAIGLMDPANLLVQQLRRIDALIDAPAK